MSEQRKNHLIIDGGQGGDDDHVVASYKPIPESDTDENEYMEADVEYLQLNHTETMDGDIADDIDDHWDHDGIVEMLNLYVQNLDKFRNPKIRKKNLWMDISNEVGKSPDSCNKKFRNMKQTYVRLLKKKNSSGLVTVKWPYFDIFEEIYCIDGEYQPEIQQKMQDGSNESIAKALLSISMPTNIEDTQRNGESSGMGDEVRKRLARKRNADLRKATLEIRDRQRLVEEKLDRLINIVQESNNIQEERNRLFQEFLEKMSQSQNSCGS